MTSFEDQNKNRILWAEALESGKYKQGANILSYDDCFCCLGVMCDLEDSTLWTKDFLGPSNFWGRGMHKFYPPEDVLEKYGLNNLAYGKYSSMNDRGNSSFIEIAQEIRNDVLERQKTQDGRSSVKDRE